jgi:ubiquinone/menaquinone biosynthesis C-methylase UbiE
MPDRLDEIRQSFDQRAERYDDSVMHQSLATAVADSLSLVGARTVLDIATGTGLVLRALHRSGRASGIHLAGADISPQMLRVAKRELPSAEWVEADASRLPFADASADVVTCVTALHIIPDVPAALSEWSRVLRPGGRLVTATFASAHLPAATGQAPSHPYPRDHAPYATVEALAATFRPFGFELEAHSEWSDGTDSVLIADFIALGDA